MLSPDTERLLEAASAVRGGSSIVPEDLDCLVTDMLLMLGKRSDVSGFKPSERRAYLLGYAERIKDENSKL